MVSVCCDGGVFSCAFFSASSCGGGVSFLGAVSVVFVILVFLSYGEYGTMA